MSEMAEKRLEAAERIRGYGSRDLGFLGSLRKPIYSNGIRTSNHDRTTWMVLMRSAPKSLSSDSVEGTEVSMLVAALEWDDLDQSWTQPIRDLAADDLVQVGGKWLTVFSPGALAPSGEPILYGCRAGVRKVVA